MGGSERVCVCVVGGEGVEVEEKVPADFKSSRLCTLYAKVLNESPTFLQLRWHDWRAHTSVMAKWCDMTVYGAQHTLVSWVRLKPVDRMCTSNCCDSQRDVRLVLTQDAAHSSARIFKT